MKATVVFIILFFYFFPTFVSLGRMTKCPFRCSSSTKCLKGNLVCNGVKDCPNGEDEEDCVDTCNEDEFSCVDYCMPKSVLCNGVRDCPDGSDERRCSVTSKPSSSKKDLFPPNLASSATSRRKYNWSVLMDCLLLTLIAIITIKISR